MSKEFELPYTGDKLLELLGNIKTEEELKAFIKANISGCGHTDEQIRVIVAEWYQQNKETPVTKEDVDGWIEEYLAENPVSGGLTEQKVNEIVAAYIRDNNISGSVSAEEIAQAVENYITEHPIEGGDTVTDEQIASAVDSYFVENPVSDELVEPYIETNKIRGIVNSPVQNLNCVWFGDSLSTDSIKGYTPDVFAQFAHFKTFNKYANGGMRMSFNTDTVLNTSFTSASDNCLYNKYAIFKNDYEAGNVPKPDVIMVMLGTNDVIQDKDLGDLDVAFTAEEQSENVGDLATVAQSFRYFSDKFMNDFPEAKVIWITPPPLATKSWYKGIVAYRNMIISCCEITGDMYIDGTTISPIRWYKEAMNNEHMTGDNIHLNGLGYTKFAKSIYNSFISLPWVQEKAFDVVDTIEYNYHIRCALSDSYDSGNSMGTGSIYVFDEAIPSGKAIELVARCYKSGVVKIAIFENVDNSTYRRRKAVYVKEFEYTTGDNHFKIGYTSDKEYYVGIIVDSSKGSGFAQRLLRSTEYPGVFSTGYAYSSLAIDSVVTLGALSTTPDTYNYNIYLKTIDVGTVEDVTYNVRNTLTNVTNSNSVSKVKENNSYSATLTVNSGYTLDGVTITMGGTDVTSSVYSDGVISIASVTGDIVITASATEIDCTGITLDKTSLEFTDTSQQTLVATVTPTDCVQSVIWATSDSTVATVANGVVTPLKKGTTTITATCGSYSATCEVIVSIEEIATYTITNNLTNVTSDNSTTTVSENVSYSATLTADSGYTLDTVTITMGSEDITSTVYSDGVINISVVTGDIVITASASQSSSGDTSTVWEWDGTSTELPEGCTASGLTVMSDSNGNYLTAETDGTHGNLYIDNSIGEGTLEVTMMVTSRDTNNQFIFELFPEEGKKVSVGQQNAYYNFSGTLGEAVGEKTMVTFKLSSDGTIMKNGSVVSEAGNFATVTTTTNTRVRASYQTVKIYSIKYTSNS